MGMIEDPLTTISNQKEVEYRRTGNKLAKAQQYETAIKVYSKAIELGSKDPMFYANRSQCFLCMGLYQKSVEDASKAVELDSRFEKAFYLRAIAYEKLGNFERALEDCEKLIALNPDVQLFSEALDRIEEAEKKTRQLNILELHKRVPILEDILRYVPQRQQAVLTCKAFYTSTCHVEKFKHLLLLKDDHFEDDYQILINSQRRFNKFRIVGKNCMNMEKLLTLLRRFGSEIENAQIDSLSTNNLVSVLKCLPNIETLFLSSYDVRRRGDHNLEFVESITLHKLKALTMHYNGNKKTEAVFKMIPEGALQDLSMFEDIDGNLMNEFLKSQGNIKKLFVYEALNLKPFLQLQLESLAGSFVAEKENELLEFIAAQNELSSLKVFSEVTESLLDVIVLSLKNLRTLSLAISKIITPEFMQQLSTLPNLTDLSLEVKNNEGNSTDNNIEALSMIKMPLKKLKLTEEKFKTVGNSIAQLGLSFHCLKEIALENIVPTDMHSLFDNLPLLEIASFCRQRFSKEIILPSFTNANAKYVHMKELHISYHLEPYKQNNETLLKWLKAMPNLQVLIMNNFNSFHYDETILEILEQSRHLKKFMMRTIFLPKNFKIHDRLIEVLKSFNLLKSIRMDFIKNKKFMMLLKNALVDNNLHELKVSLMPMPLSFSILDVDNEKKCYQMSCDFE